MKGKALARWAQLEAQIRRHEDAAPVSAAEQVKVKRFRKRRRKYAGLSRRRAKAALS